MLFMKLIAALHLSYNSISRLCLDIEGEVEKRTE